MKNLLQRLIKIAAYSAAGIVILLAVAVGLFRLFLPRLPEYQEEIKDWASAAIGMQVEFTGMDARWGLRGPELKFYGAELIRPSNQSRIVAAEEVGVGVSFIRLLRDRTLVVDEVTVSNTSVELRQRDDGSWQFQGSTFDEFKLPQKGDAAAIGPIAVIGDNIEVSVIQPGDERPSFFEIARMTLQRDDVRIAVDADIRLPDTFGRQMSLSATQILSSPGTDSVWNVSVESSDIDLAGFSELLPDDSRTVAGGRGDIDLALALSGQKITRASATVDFENVQLADATAFDVRGRVAFSNEADGWLVAADDFSLTTAEGSWPNSSLRMETSVDEQGDIVMLDARASYLNLSDVDLLLPWLSDTQRAMVRELRAGGVVQDLVATLSDLDTEAPRYAVSADLQSIGFAPKDKRPGARGVTGSLRVDHNGGLVEINSVDVTLRLSNWISDPIILDVIDGTVIWRRSNARTTIISDNIAIRNRFFDSQSSVEITMEADGSPVIDLASTWSIDDISRAKRYIPEGIMKPRLFLWFQDALISGRMPRGTTRFVGPLDKFPFDGDEGEFAVRASVADLAFRYARQFPVTQVSEMEVTLDKTRLYTESNQSSTLGTSTTDAKVEIADLRKPILTIDSFSRSSLPSLRNFSASSPIGRIFGGQLDRVVVDGDATIKLDLTIPLTNTKAYEFTARILSTDGSIEIDGLKPPIDELSGAVTVQRNSVSSESLGGRFLGSPVSIELQNAPSDMQQFRVIANASGAVTAAALIEAFDMPFVQHLKGDALYRANILFPRANNESPAPLTVQIETDLVGISSDLPPPFQKEAEAALLLAGDLSFLPGGEVIRTEGQSVDRFAWQLDFAKTDNAWDFDRGVLTLGAAPMTQPEVRGLHVRGETPTLRLEDWLALSSGENAEFNAAERVRSIDVTVSDLYLLGQHLKNHQVRVDRSASDWLVQFDGEQVSGSAFVPYDFSADRALVLDMQRLILPGDDADIDDDAAVKAPLDPRTLPSISLKATEFAIGNRFLGEVIAEFAKTEDGLTTDSIISKDPSFEVVGNGRWVTDATDPLQSRSYLTATLTSSDVEETMRRLDYQPGIVSKDMGILMDLSWSGGPSTDFLDTLDGEVQVRFGSGQLVEVEPGAGRMFGLMSVVALPRRLSLDFRDVFQKGFGFDKISGTFRIDDGAAYTCDLSLEGPAADIGIIGRADLVDRDYSQTAVVSTNVGNTLPVVGALAAGPQAAAALFLFSQIFKKPLQDIGQVFYSVSGSWDEPAVQTADAEAFTKSGELAGCLQDSE